MSKPFEVTGDWLAGFIDGEGSFNISHHAGNYQPRFSLKLRDDDTAILKAIQIFVGIGTVRGSKCSPRNSKYYSPKARNQTRFDITGSHNTKLVNILDQHQLRSKKLRDYLIWKEAVNIYSESLFNRWSDSKLKKLRNKKLLALKLELENTRRYYEKV
jgi:hypothetical protein